MDRRELREDFRSSHHRAHSFLGDFFRGLHTVAHVTNDVARIAGAVKHTVDVIKGDVPPLRPPVWHPFGLPRFWGIYERYPYFLRCLHRHPWGRPHHHVPPMIPLGHRHGRW